MNYKPLFFIFSILTFTLLGAGCAEKPLADSPYQVEANTNNAATDTETPSQAEADMSDTSMAADSTSTDLSMNKTYAFPGMLPAEEVNKKVRIKTNKGDIVIQVDAKAGPNAASNFVYLVKEGFYDGTIFHRVIPGFMIQGGDPSGTGMGGPGYQFDNDPVGQLPEKTIAIQGTTMTAPVYEKGTVAMANAGPDTNGSQFFVMVADYPLQPNYSIFGHVIEGQEIADAISNLPRNAEDRPDEEVKMLSVVTEE